jgi:hypothetical protein
MKRLLAVGFFLLSCSEPEPTLTPDQERLAEAYAAILITFERQKAQGNPVTEEAYRLRADSVLARFGFTADEFRSQLQELATKPAAYREFYRHTTKQFGK